ncbi:MAG: zf-HC2 domain-containing protein [Chloroflexota bacterium]
MNCQQIQNLLLAYLDGEVTPSEHTLVDTHLAGCYQCQQKLETLSTLQLQLRQTLTHSSQVTPSPEAWSHLQEKINRTNNESSITPATSSAWLTIQQWVPLSWMEAAQPSIQKFSNWRRLAPNVSHKHLLTQLSLETFGDIQMKKRYFFATITAVTLLLMTIFLLPDTTPIVSAQEVMERSAAAQATPSTIQGILHTKSEGFFDMTAIHPEGSEATTLIPKRIIYEDFIDLTSGNYRSVMQAAETGQIMNIFGQDNTYIYFGHRQVATETLTLYRSIIPPDQQQGWQPFIPEPFELDSQTLFEQARQSPDVEYVGQEPWIDGRTVHVLRFKPLFEISAEGATGSVATITVFEPGDEGNLANHDIPQMTAIEIPPIISTMYYDAETFELLETRETIEQNGEEVLVGYHRQLLNELLSPETAIAWDYSDLAEITVVDDTTGEHIPFLAFATEILSEEAFLAQVDFIPYLLTPTPDGYTLQITAMDSPIVYFTEDTTEPTVEEAAMLYTMTYHNQEGKFIDLTGPDLFPREAIDTLEGIELYEAANGVKFYGMPVDDIHSNVMIGNGAFAPHLGAVEMIMTAPLDLEDVTPEQSTIVESGIIVDAVPSVGVGPVSIDDTITFGFIETPDGVRLSLTSNLSLDEIKQMIETLAPAK